MNDELKQYTSKELSQALKEKREHARLHRKETAIAKLENRIAAIENKIEALRCRHLELVAALDTAKTVEAGE